MTSFTDIIRNSAVAAGTNSSVLPPEGSAIVTLVNTALTEAALTQGILLPQVWTRDALPTIILVPAAEWLAPLTTAIDMRGGKVWTCWPGKGTGDLETVLCIEDGAGVWIAAQSDLVPSLVRRTAERVLSIPPLTSSVISSAIAAATGSTIDIVDSDWSGLTLPLVAVAIGGGATAEACRSRLRNWAEPVEPGTAELDNPGIWPPAALPIDGPPSQWAEETLALLTGLKSGAVPPGLLRHTLLVGPPGCGKSSLVQHLARAAAVPIEITSLAGLFAASSGHLDAVIKALLDFFVRLRAHQGPAIGVIEEIDAMSTRRAENDRNGAYWTTLITSLLLAIDALNDTKAPILLVACTNRPHAVDPALRRQGRLGRLIEMGPPGSPEAVAAVLRAHLKQDLPHADLDGLARALLGQTHAQLADRITAARIRALVDNRPLLAADLDPEGEADDSDMLVVLRHIATHEAGHAVVALVLGRSVKGMELTGTGTNPTGATYLAPRALGATLEERLDDITIALAGRSADRLISGRIDDGASHDLLRASHALAALYLGSGVGNSLLTLYPDAVARRLEIDPILHARVEIGLQTQASRADALVRQERAAIMVLADALFVHRTLDQAAVAAILKAAVS